MVRFRPLYKTEAQHTAHAQSRDDIAISGDKQGVMFTWALSKFMFAWQLYCVVVLTICI